MPIPTYDKFIEPIPRYLAANPTGAAAKDVHDAAAFALGLTDADRTTLLPSGVQPVYKNRAGWAHDRLKRAGLSSSPRRGYWQLTEKGAEFARLHPVALSASDVERLASDFMDVRLRPPVGNEGVLPQDSVSTPLATLASPDERLGEALIELRKTVVRELQEALAHVSPSFFEAIVLELLHQMGYGTSRSDLHQVMAESMGLSPSIDSV